MQRDAYVERRYLNCWQAGYYHRNERNRNESVERFFQDLNIAVQSDAGSYIASILNFSELINYCQLICI